MLFRSNGADAGKQIQCLAHGHVQAAKALADRRLKRPLHGQPKGMVGITMSEQGAIFKEAVEKAKQ